MAGRIRAVVFDVGETLVDETRAWGAWADWMGVPRFTFFAVYGAVIARGWHHRRVFQEIDPTFDFDAERRDRDLPRRRRSLRRRCDYDRWAIETPSALGQGFQGIAVTPSWERMIMICIGNPSHCGNRARCHEIIITSQNGDFRL